MFMQRIDVPAEVTAKPKPIALKLVAGLLFLIVSALVTAPWFCAVALWFAVAAGIRAIGRIARTCYETLCYAGELVVGR